MPDYSVPRWLEPPSEMEQQKIQEATSAATVRGVQMLRRAIGMRRVQAEAQEAQQSGVDPITAKQNALINNAHLLFTPEETATFVNKAEVNQVKELAALQHAQYLRSQLDMTERLRDIQQQRADDAAKAAEQKATDARERAASEALRKHSEFQEKEKRLFQTGEDRLGLGRDTLKERQYQFDIRSDQRDQTLDEKKAESEQKAKLEQAKEEGRNKRQRERTAAQAKKMLATDPELKRLHEDLGSKQRLLSSLEVEKPGWFSRHQGEIDKEKEVTKAAIEDLKKDIRDREQGLRSDISSLTGMADEEGDQEETGTATETAPTEKVIGGFKVRRK